MPNEPGPRVRVVTESTDRTLKEFIMWRQTSNYKQCDSVVTREVGKGHYGNIYREEAFSKARV